MLQKWILLLHSILDISGLATASSLLNLTQLHFFLIGVVEFGTKVAAETDTIYHYSSLFSMKNRDKSTSY